MKTFALLISSFLIHCSINGQRVLGEYENSRTGKSCSIILNSDTTEKYTVIFPFCDLDLGIDYACLKLDKFQNADLVKAMTFARSKFIEWSAIAQENKITDFQKTIQKNKVVCSAYFRNSTDSHEDYRVDILIDFMVVNGNCFLRLRTDRIVSQSNQFVNISPFSTYFSSVSDVEFFMKVISPISVEKEVNDYASKLKLFKE